MNWSNLIRSYNLNTRKSCNINRLFVGPKISLIYVPSSRYFQVSDLKTTSYIYEKDDLSKYSDSESIEISRQYDLSGNLLEISARNAGNQIKGNFIGKSLITTSKSTKNLSCHTEYTLDNNLFMEMKK